MTTEQTPATPVRKDWKYRLGIGLVIYSMIPICTVELVAFLPMTGTQALAFGAVYLASGEIAFFAAVALLGKPFIQSIKDKIKALFLRRKEASKPRMISKRRHCIGVTLLLLSTLPYYITIGALLFTHPGESGLQVLLAMLLSGELLFFVSLFVLGEEFWARLKRLFQWPGDEQEQAAGS